MSQITSLSAKISLAPGCLWVAGKGEPAGSREGSQCCWPPCPPSRVESVEDAGTEVRFAAYAGPHAALIPPLSLSGLDRSALALANLHNDINIFTNTFALQGIFLNSKND